jgi:hypothetical protein
MVSGHFRLRNTSAYHCESPNFDIGTTTEKLLQIPRLWFRITTIPVDGIDDELCFPLIEEVPRRVRFVREIDQCPVSNDAQEASQRPFDDEDPSSPD